MTSKSQWGCLRLTPYLSETQKENLKIYRYAGGDYGFAYIYFYNPVATNLVEYLPETLAPNVITLAGFAFSAGPFIYLFTNHDLENTKDHIPNWFFFLQAFCYFMYRMLDEMDGK